MICENCGHEYEGKRCPVCQKNKVNGAILALLKATAYTVAFVAIQFVVQFAFLMVKAFSVLLSGASEEDAYGIIMDALFDNVCKMTVLSSLVTILAVGIFFLVRRRSATREVWLAPVSLKTLGLAALFGAVLQVVISITVECIPWPRPWIDDLMELNDFILVESLPWQLFAVVLLGPITEELIFRGLVYTRLRRATTPLAAAILSGIAFGAVHGNMIQFFYAFALGVVLALVMERYGSLHPCIIIHIFFNGISFLPYYDLGAGGLIGLYLICILLTVLCTHLIWFNKKDTRNGKDISNEAL